MGQFWPLFVYFRSFLTTISIQFEKSIDGVLGIRTRGRRMVGADETMELMRPPKIYNFLVLQNVPTIFTSNLPWEQSAIQDNPGLIMFHYGFKNNPRLI